LADPGASAGLERLRRMDPVGGPYPTVELAWSLSALCVAGSDCTDHALADSIAHRLLSAFNPQSCLFAHWPIPGRSSWLRAHAACFADLVYPIQALSYYHQATTSTEALDAARQCARRMCRLQGPQGQWWWHYDVRTGRVIEKYPVYAVHQDAMAPMALFALQHACGENFDQWIHKGLRWLEHPPELPISLIDHHADVIWRKVFRREPMKTSRAVQTLLTRIHPSLRMPGLDLVFPPKCVDRESRPYHMGWILHAWPENRVSLSSETQQRIARSLSY